MENENDQNTPGSCMTDEEYKASIIKKFGHIRGLTKTLLMIRKGNKKYGEDFYDKYTDKFYTRDDMANYHQLRKDVDQARKILNRLHIRLTYAEKEKSYPDIPYVEMQKMMGEVQRILSNAQGFYIDPNKDRQKEDLMLDYIDFEYKG